MLGSTGIGQGIALPHARLAALQEFFGMFARLGRPVDPVFLLLIPEEAGDDNQGALACISRKLRNPAATKALRTARTAPERYNTLTLVEPDPVQCD
jgi:PTS system nitrogen regulatory IIA component